MTSTNKQLDDQLERLYEMRNETYVPSTSEPDEWVDDYRRITVKELTKKAEMYEYLVPHKSPFHSFQCMKQAELYLEDWKHEHEECFKIALNAGVKTKDQALSFMFVHMRDVDCVDFGTKSWGRSYFDELWENRASWKKKAKHTQEGLTI